MSFSNDKSISLDWNGTQFLLTARPETGLGFHYATSIDGITWTAHTTPSDMLDTQSIYQTKWTGQTFQFVGNLQTTDNRSVLGHTNELAENRLLIPPHASSLPLPTISDMDINAEHPHTLTFPRHMSLVFGAGEPNGKNIAYSYTDGRDWQPTVECPFSTAAFAGDWNGQYWMAVGAGTNHTLAFSKDGIHWKGRGKFIFSQEGRAIQWSAVHHLWVAGGKGQSALAYSHDGLFWTGIESIGNMTECYTLCQHDSFWISGGLGGMAYSPNGKQWYPVQNGFDQICQDIQWNGSFWIAIGKNESTNHTFALSSDGIHWTTHSNSIFSGIELAQLCTPGSTYTTLVIGDDVAVYATLHNQFSVYDRIDLSSDMTETTAVGHHGSFFLVGGGNKIKTSVDGFHWVSAETVPFTSISSFSWNRSNEGLLRVHPGTVAVGEGPSTLAYSADGILWKGLGHSLFPVRGNAVKWNGSYWAAVGLSDTESALSGYTNAWIAISSNGYEWHAQDVDAPLLTEGRDIEWNGSQWIAVGVGETYSMVSSLDGIHWEGISLPEEYAFEGTRILWTGTYWIGIGSGVYTCLTSPDGRIWTPQPYVGLESNLSPIRATGNVGLQSSSGTDTLPAIYDGVFNTSSWKSDENVYNSLTGEYEGSVYTLVSGEQVSGEWIEFTLDSTQILAQWFAGWTVQTPLLHTAYPKHIYVAGSVDEGTTWQSLDRFEWTSDSAPMPDDGTTPLYLPRPVPISEQAISKIRFIFPRIFGGNATYVELGELEIWTQPPISTMDIRYTPLLLPDSILFPTVRPQWISTTPYVWIDRRQMVERHGPLSNGHCMTRLLPTDGFITSACLTETMCLAATSTHQLIGLPYESMNWTTEWNENTLDANLDSISGLAYNQSRIVAGGSSKITYHTLTEYTPGHWTDGLSITGLFTSVRAIHSNSGLGPTFIPNCISLSAKEVVLLVGPKYYEPNTAMSFCIEFQKRTPISNIPALSETIVNYYRGDRGPMGPTPTADAGPMGPPGSTEIRGPTGATGPIQPSGWTILPDSSSIYTTQRILLSSLESAGTGSYAMEIGGNVSTHHIHASAHIHPFPLPTWNESWTLLQMDYERGAHAAIEMDARVSGPFSIELLNLPSWTNKILSVSVEIDYSTIPVDRFFCQSIQIGETTYPLLHVGGTPILATTVQKYTQKITILGHATEIWKVLSIGSIQSEI